MKCEICNKEFNMLGKHIRHHNISSEKYYLKYIGDKGYCETCGKPTRFYTLDKGYERFCSVECHNTYQTGRTFRRKKSLDITCKNCGNKFKVYPSLKGRRFCCRTCYYDWEKRNLTGINNPFYGKNHNVDTLIKISGKNNHRWKGGITPKEKTIRTSTTYKDWRNKVLKRDKYKCQICHIMNSKLHVHHIKSFVNHPSERLNVDNGITLCTNCHRYVHSKYVMCVQ